MPTADNSRRRQLPRVVRATLLDAAKVSLVTQAEPVGFDVGESCKRGAGKARKLATVISIANPTQVTCAGHGFVTGDVVTIDASNSTPTIDGPRTVTFVDANNFTVPVNVTVAGTTAGIADGVPNLRSMLLRGRAVPAT